MSTAVRSSGGSVTTHSIRAAGLSSTSSTDVFFWDTSGSSCGRFTPGIVAARAQAISAGFAQWSCRGGG